ITGAGDIALTEDMQKRGIGLQTSVATSTLYMAFNMLDPVVGGNSERARKLRHAISVALDFEEMISIFRNGRGVAAQGPIPPGIFGYRDGLAGMNPYVYDWVDGRPKRKPVAYAQQLIDRMIEMLRFDAPWAWGLHPQDFTLAHAWVHNRKPNKMANNNLKYQRIDARLRETMRTQWNSPVLWPLLAALAALALALI